MRSVASFTVQSPYLCRKSFLYELDRRLDGNQNQLGHGGKRKTESLYPACNQFTLLFELSAIYKARADYIIFPNLGNIYYQSTGNLLSFIFHLKT
jgi:hypothetical protein